MPDNESSSSQTQQSQASVSAGPVTSTQNVRRVPIPTGFLRGCDQIVEDFRQDKLSKSDATFQFFQQLAHERDQPGFPGDEHAHRSLTMYIDWLENIERENAHAVQDATRQRPAGNEDAQLQEDSDDEPEERPRRRKRRRDHDDESDDGGREKVDMSLVPFDKRGRSPPVDVLVVTARLQENYGRDPALIKRKILSNPRRPDFPVSLWTDVIANTFVDLNRVFDFHFTTIGPSKRTVQHFGDFEIVTDNIKVTREVKSCGDWTCAWTRYQEAVTFLYPHRARELTDYAKHIIVTFIAVQDSPDRVIQYDKRVRARAAECVGLLLSDTAAFHSDYTQFIFSGMFGGTVSKPQSGPKSTRGRASEPCRRFNNGYCPDGAKCRYQHVCQRCGRRGHTMPNCQADSDDRRQGGPSQRK
jgi:Zinc finger C-x8-C-x5-C-x3-H type (and similar)